MAARAQGPRGVEDAVATASRRRVTIHAPSTVGNFGPGFDVLGLALASRGDRVTIEVAPADEIQLKGPGSGTIPTEWDRNCAGLAIDHLRKRFGITDSYRILIDKGVRPGSGLGSSASSSAGAALAWKALHGEAIPTSPGILIEAAAAGEGRVAGRHMDDVACVVMGGLTAVGEDADGAAVVSRFDPPRDLHLAVALPHVTLETRRMREVLPEVLPRTTAVRNLADLAQLLHAFTTNDIPAVGRAFTDAIALPSRAPLVPAFAAVRGAAIEAGAYGHCLSGSGPASVAITDDADHAEVIAAAMLEAIENEGLEGEAFASEPLRTVPYDDAQVS